MLRSPKTIVGHEVGAMVMNSCNIFKICKVIKHEIYTNKDVYGFSSVRIKSSYNNLLFNMCHCFIQLQSYTVLVHHSTTMFVKDIYMIIFCLMEALEMFFQFYFFWKCNIWDVCELWLCWRIWCNKLILRLWMITCEWQYVFSLRTNNSQLTNVVESFHFLNGTFNNIKIWIM